MDRREFLKAAALTGLAVSVPSSLALKSAQAQAGAYQGLFVISVDAGGGWDPTSLVDPKGYTINQPPGNTNTDVMNRTYAASQIITRGGIKHAPLFHQANNGALALPNGQTLQGQGIAITARGNYDDFFHKHASSMYVINGIDCQTNDHDAGRRANWSGRLVEGFPAFGALFAGSLAGDKPMAYIAGGGYEVTAGTVAATRAGSINVLTSIAKPNARYGDQTYHTQDTYDRITRYQQERLQAAIEQRRLPRWRNALSTLFTVRSGNSELTRLNDLLNAPYPGGGTLYESLNSNQLSGQNRQVRLGLAAYRAGIAAALNIGYGGFDTHQGHDVNQTDSLRELLFGVDFILDEMDRQGIPRNKVLIIVASDFGRTPGYNADSGKDHWSTTSMMFIGGGVPGGKTVGGTTDGDRATAHRPLPVNPATLQVLAASDTSGVRITPQHVAKALRKFTQIADLPKASEFALDPVTEDMPFFT